MFSTSSVIPQHFKNIHCLLPQSFYVIHILREKKKFSMCVCACLCAHVSVCVGPESRAAPMLNACDMPYWNLWNYILLEYCLLLALSPWVFLNCCCLENIDLFRDPYDFYPPQVPPWDKRRSFSFVMCPTSCWSHDTE